MEKQRGRESFQLHNDLRLPTPVLPSANAGYIYFKPSRDLNIIETNIIGARYDATIPVETQFRTNIDTDNFDRILGIEILAPGFLMMELRRRASG